MSRWCRVSRCFAAAFQPINGWLREVAFLPVEPPAWFQPRWRVWSAERARMEGHHARRDAAMDASSSYGATIGHLIAAVRKLAAVNTAEENGRTLYRGLVRTTHDGTRGRVRTLRSGLALEHR